MSEDQSAVAGRRRARGATALARKEALERLQALRRGGRREMDAGGFQIKMEQPIYDTVDEDQYEALVAKRREEVKGFIVDDNGLGYGDEGQEEDWSLAGVSLSSEESEGESERPKRKKNNSNSEKKEKEIVKKPSGLASAAALMGKQRISNMFTSSVFKKDKQMNISCESIVDDVIAEFVPDESDRERRRRSNLNNLGLGSVNNTVLSTPGALPVRIEKLATSCVILDVKNDIDKIDGSLGDVNNESRKDSITDVEIVRSKEKSLLVIEGGIDLSGVTQIEEMKANNEANGHDSSKCLPPKAEAKEVEKKVFSLNAKIEEAKDPALCATVGWKAVRSAGQNGMVDGNESRPEVNQIKITEEKLDFEVETDGSLPFYILDAHEEIYGANAANLYLFGKVKSGGTYHSCCVVVKNMQRCTYAIPTVSFRHSDRIMELEKVVEESRMPLMVSKDTISKQGRDGERSRISSTDSKDIPKLEKDFEESQIALRSQLHELASDLKTEITKELLERNVSSFSLTPVKRNYAFERSDIPHGENYVLKISYPFKDPPLPSDLKGNNFCALLGTQNRSLFKLLSLVMSLACKALEVAANCSSIWH